jgi:hypothetical protein
MKNSSDQVRAATPRLSRALARLERSRAQMLELLQQHSDEQTLHRPGPGRWSGLEVLDHAQLVERSVLRLLASPPPETPPNLNPSRLARTVRMLPARLRLWTLAHRFGKVEAPAMVRPKSVLSRAGVFEQAAESREATRRFMADSLPARLAAVHRVHPVLGRFDGFEWLEFLAAHEDGTWVSCAMLCASPPMIFRSDSYRCARRARSASRRVDPWPRTC